MQSESKKNLIEGIKMEQSVLSSLYLNFLNIKIISISLKEIILLY